MQLLKYTGSKHPFAASAKARFFQNASNITNISAIWRPGVAVPDGVGGVTTASVSLIAANDTWLKAGVMRMPNGELHRWLIYFSPARLSIVQPVPMPKELDHIYFEIDVEPKRSQVTFWINDEGLDVGFLPGFKGGAQQAMWDAQVTDDAHLIHGTFTDCAYAAAGKWIACDFGVNNAEHYKLKDHHHVEILSSRSFAIGDKRSLA